jgi:hypothetical protein
VNFRVLPEANGEVTEALGWFAERHRFRALGLLWSMWLDGLDRIEANPRMYPRAEDNSTPYEIRNFILPNYGYRIVYQIQGNDLVVLSLCRGQRRSAHWLDRVQTP